MGVVVEAFRDATSRKGIASANIIAELCLMMAREERKGANGNECSCQVAKSKIERRRCEGSLGRSGLKKY